LVFFDGVRQRGGLSGQRTIPLLQLQRLRHLNPLIKRLLYSSSAAPAQRNPWHRILLLCLVVLLEARLLSCLVLRAGLGPRIDHVDLLELAHFHALVRILRIRTT